MSVNGWLLLDKPQGLSSAAAVGTVKRLLNIKKVGHGGTLDPLASGLLPLALGEATKLCSYMLQTHKAYEFTVTWGQQRDTDDEEGQVIATSDHRPNEADIEQVLKAFQGPLLQQPPLYSAIKLQGKRACDRLRKGETVSLQPRAITIDVFTLIQAKACSARFYIKCSKGTYVRALARDIGQALGTYGYISELRRLECGKFHIKDAIMLEKLAKDPEKGLLKYIRPLHSVLDDIPAVVIGEDECHRLRLGQRVFCTPGPSGIVAVFDPNKLFIGLASRVDQILHPKRLMVYTLATKG